MIQIKKKNKTYSKKTTATTTGSTNILTSIFITLISLYQKTISPFTLPSCRFLPTCSDYAKEALTIWGPYKGTLLTIKRLGRCHPFSAQRVDPVPANDKK